jgi:hypothetical protein
MIKRNYIIALALLLEIPIYGMAQCSNIVKAEENGLLSRKEPMLGKAVIFDTPMNIPQLRLQFVDAKSGKKITPKLVTITYSWEWLEYPYPEHAWGAWSDAFDFLKCTPNQSEEELIVPEYKLLPRGWYEGKYTNFPWSRKPKFGGIGIHIEEEKCSSGFGIKKGDFKKYENAVAIINLSCPAKPKIKFVKPGK